MPDTVDSGRLGEPRDVTRVLVIMPTTSDRLRTAGHPWAATIPILCSFLIQAGFEVHLSDNLDRVKNPNDIPDGPGQEEGGNEGLPYFDVVVFHGKIQQVDSVAVQALKEFVAGGKGLVVIHIASASFTIDTDPVTKKPITKVSEDWKNLIGSMWVYGVSEHPEPAQPVTVTLTDIQHPILAGLPTEFTLAKEELYLFDKLVKSDQGPGNPLAQGRTFDIKNRVEISEPVAFTLERGKGRVLNMYIGHFISTHHDWRFQKMITQGVAWAAHR